MTAVVVDELSFSYRDDDPVIERLSATFAPGTTTAITGPSGRGKSTLLYLLGLMLTPSAGTVSVGGTVASTMSDAGRSQVRARHIGFVFQDAALDQDRTVLDNVIEGAIYAGLDRSEAIGRARELLERYGVETRWSHRPGEVSGGQAQRIALCRALLTAPSVVLADEPTGNLDLASSGLVLDGLNDAASAGATVIIATHDPRVTDRVQSVFDLGSDGTQRRAG